jgi:hypothetical protein
MEGPWSMGVAADLPAPWRVEARRRGDERRKKTIILVYKF